MAAAPISTNTAYQQQIPAAQPMPINDTGTGTTSKDLPPVDPLEIVCDVCIPPVGVAMSTHSVPEVGVDFLLSLCGCIPGAVCVVVGNRFEN
jgi:uncharacterized membrane protein YqaE (UPF0057 family)